MKPFKPWIHETFETIKPRNHAQQFYNFVLFVLEYLIANYKLHLKKNLLGLQESYIYT